MGMNKATQINTLKTSRNEMFLYMLIDKNI